MNLGAKIPRYQLLVCCFFFPLCCFFHSRDQHFQVLQSLPTFSCSASAQWVTTGCFRFFSNPISPGVWMGFLKPCPETWCWVCCAGCLSGCWWGQHRAQQNALGLLVVCVLPRCPSAQVSTVASSILWEFFLWRVSVLHILAGQLFCAWAGCTWELLAPAARGVPCILQVGHSGLHEMNSSTPCPHTTMQVHFGHLSVIWLFISTFLTSVRCF